MKKRLLRLLTVALALLAGPALAVEPDEGPVQEESGADPGSGEELMVTLRVPLDSPLFSETPVAVVDEEPITFRDLRRSISGSHAGRSREATAAKRDYARLLNRRIRTKLIVEEARNIGLDELPEIESQIEAFSDQLLVSTLMLQQVEEVEPDAEEVEALYRRMSREFLLTTVSFAKEEDALSFEERCKSGADFDEVASRFIEEGRAKGEAGEQQYLKLKDFRPQIAQVLIDLEPDAVSQIFTSDEGFLLFHVEDMRFYEDPAVREEAHQLILAPLKKQRAGEYGDFLERKYAEIDEELLKEVNFEVGEKGFLWFKKEKPVDLERFLKDKRVLATVRGDEAFTVTVADLARELKQATFHGLEAAIERGEELNQKKQIILKNMLFKRTARAEAIAQGLDETEEYLEAVDENTDAILFGAFMAKVVAPDLKISEEEVRQYYDTHLSEFSSPRMFRMNGLAFETLADAQKALEKLRKGADFTWVSANTRGQVDKDERNISIFDNALLSLTAMPEELRKQAEGAKQGDSLAYSDANGIHYVISVDRVFEARPEAYEAARPRIARSISEEKIGELLDDWGGKLKEAYETRIFVIGLDD